MKKEQIAKDERELTLQPKTNKEMNKKLLEDKQALTTGDHNIDLYKKSKLKDRLNKDPEEYWFERNGQECKFRPQVNKEIYFDRGEGVKASVNEVRGMDKMMERMKKAREEAEFKKAMTLRSDFALTDGIKKAQK